MTLFVHIFTLMQMVVNENGLEFILIKDKEFLAVQRQVDKIMKVETRAGIGSLTRQAEVIYEYIENAAWKAGILGSSTPYILIQTVYFIVGKHFARRSRNEHRALTSGSNAQIKLTSVKKWRHHRKLHRTLFKDQSRWH